MSDGNSPENSVFDLYAQIEAKVLDMQISEYKGDKFAHDNFQVEYAELIKEAKNQKLDQNKVDLAETKGRLHAAIEEGNEGDEMFFRQQLEEKTR